MPPQDQAHQHQSIPALSPENVELAHLRKAQEPDPNHEDLPGTSWDEDNIVVGWDGDDDPEHPYNAPRWRIYVNAILLSILGFLVPLSSAIVAPATGQVMAEFNTTSDLLEAFVVSVFVLALAFGPLIWAPLSEIYGRLYIYHGTNLGFILFTVACALAPSLSSLIGFRFVAGFFGSCIIANGAGSFTDMMPPQRRGVFMSLYILGPILGPIIGPVGGGFLSAAIGWRWVFWLVAILAGFVAVAMLAFTQETYAPAILQHRVNCLRRETGNNRLLAKNQKDLSAWAILRHGIVRPMKLLVLSPISLICSLYMAIVYGILNLLFTSISQVYQENYNFAPNISGLAFLGLGIGSFIGMTIVSIISDRYVASRTKRHGGERKPEYRIALQPIGAVLMPAGLFIYGWTAQHKIHWIVPILGEGVTGLGLMMIFFSTILYIVDSFTIYAASALAVNGFIRSVGGGLLPLAGLTLYSKLGVGWGNSVLGFIALAILPVSLLLIRYGEYLRTRFPIRSL
ncbi:major facilitator superfamily domain-containing protein [Xylaria scruposa]|nr:major facilitator superfamily domain-containing protein [Xylaria scruposa]